MSSDKTVTVGTLVTDPRTGKTGYRNVSVHKPGDPKATHTTTQRAKTSTPVDTVKGEQEERKTATALLSDAFRKSRRNL